MKLSKLSTAALLAAALGAGESPWNSVMPKPVLYDGMSLGGGKASAKQHRRPDQKARARRDSRKQSKASRRRNR